MENYNYLDNQNHKINNSLNVLKCVAILSVICIHCLLYKLGTFGSIVDGLSRFAIPFFFLIAGFYSFYRDDNFSINKYKTRIIGLLKLLVIANIVYVIFYYITVPNYNILAIFDINSCISYLLFNISPTAGHLWFLQALLYCYILAYILKRLNIKINNLYYLIPLLLLVNIILGEFSNFIGIDSINLYYRNFLFMGLPFFVLGYLIHDKQDKINSLFSNRVTLLGILVAFFIIILEILLEGNIQDLFLGTIFFATLLFIYCVNNPHRLNFGIIGWIGGNICISMYVWHMLVIQLLNPYLHFNYFNPVIIFVITAIISTIIYYFKKI